MGERTAITWTNHTFNIFWGCQHAPAEPGSSETSPECRNCYAEAFDKRTGGTHWGAGPRRFFGDAYWAKPLAWNAAAERAGVRARVFCSSMADWAELHPDPLVNSGMDASRARMWSLIRATPWLDWLLLTKRADRLPYLLPWERVRICGCGGVCDSGIPCPMRRDERPWPNVWVGVTCGVRRSLWRIAELRKVRAALRFVSCEPLLEHITAADWDAALHTPGMPLGDTDYASGRLHWLIVGDESGPKSGEHARRPAQADWIRTARDAAARHGVTFHLKQLHLQGPAVQGERGKNGIVHLPIFDGRRHPNIPPSPAVVDLES